MLALHGALWGSPDNARRHGKSESQPCTGDAAARTYAYAPKLRVRRILEPPLDFVM